MNEHLRDSCKICSRPNVVNSSIIDVRKIKFITSIYIRFNQNLDVNSYISTKIEAITHLQAIFRLTSERRRWRHDVAIVQSDRRDSWFILTSVTSPGTMLHFVPALYYRVSQ